MLGVVRELTLGEQGPEGEELHEGHNVLHRALGKDRHVALGGALGILGLVIELRVVHRVVNDGVLPLLAKGGESQLNEARRGEAVVFAHAQDEAVGVLVNEGGEHVKDGGGVHPRNHPHRYVPQQGGRDLVHQGPYVPLQAHEGHDAGCAAPEDAVQTFGLGELLQDLLATVDVPLRVWSNHFL